MELSEDNAKKLEPEIVIDKYEIQDLLCGIERCCERLGKLIELHAPMIIVQREVRMIQHRALSVLSCYEAFALLKWVYKDEEKEAETELEPTSPTQAVV